MTMLCFLAHNSKESEESCIKTCIPTVNHEEQHNLGIEFKATN